MEKFLCCGIDRHLNSISLSTLKRNIISFEFDYTFSPNQLYILAIEDSNCSDIQEILNWEDFKEIVLSPIIDAVDTEDKAYEYCADAIIRIENSKKIESTSVIECVLNFNSKDEKLDLLRYYILSILITKYKQVGWSLAKAQVLFPHAGNQISYFTDVECDVYEVLINNRQDKKLWEDAMTHDPSIVELATSKDDRDLFFKYAPLLHVDDICSRADYQKEDYSRENFFLIHDSLFREHANLFKKYICSNAVIFDLEGNAEKGWAWEYYAKSLSNSKEASFNRIIDETGHYHHIDEKEWVDFDNLICNSKIIIGHNIKNHDCKLLARRKNNLLKLDRNVLWDTLEIEMLLCPNRDSYALVVPHNAIDDVKVTEQLFWSQIERLLKSPDLYERVSDFLPIAVIDYIKRNIFAIEMPYLSKHLKVRDVNVDSLFYRYRHYNFPDIDLDDNTLIITPKQYWRDLVSALDDKVTFIYNDEDYDQFAFLDREKILERFSSSQSAVERAFCHLVSSSYHLRICSIPDIFIKTIGINKILDLVDEKGNTNNTRIYCTDTYNYFSCKAFTPIKIEHVILLDLEEGSICGGKDYMGINNDEEGILLKSLKRNGAYSTCKKRLFVDPNCLNSIVNEKDIETYSFWAFQPDQKTLRLMYHVDTVRLLESIRRDGITDIGEDEWGYNYYCNDNIYYASIADHNNRLPSSSAELREYYWRQQYEIILGVESQFPKIWILETNKEVDEITSYIPELRNSNYNLPLYRTLENALSDYSNVWLISWDDIFKNKRCVDGRYSFFVNDISRFISLQNLSYRTLSEVSYTNRVLNNINNILLDFGFGSNLFIIDPVFDAYRHLLPQVFGYDNILSIPTENLWINEFNGNNPNDNALSEDVIKWIDEESRLLYDVKNNIKYCLSDIQKIAIRKHCSNTHGQNFLTVIPTGGGKSVIFQGPLLYGALKKKSAKLSIVITPLQALMKDQVDDIVEKNSDIYQPRVAYLHSGVSAARQAEVIRSIQSKQLTLLYISPERLLFRHFFNNAILYAAVNQGIDTIIFDEAHCITGWGTDFRPSYIFALRKCLELQERNPEIRIQMYTATMSHQSELELRHYIKLPTSNIVPSGYSEDEVEINQYLEALCPIREHIDLAVNYIGEKAKLTQKVESIWSQISDSSVLGTDNLLSGKSRALIFTKSRKDASEGAKHLKELTKDTGLENKIGFFHAKLNDKEKVRIANAYKTGDIVILFSTKAFGMGMNVKNIHFVGHLTPPTFIEDYLQEVGRAGRDKALLPGGRDSISAVCLYTDYDINKISNYDSDLKWEDLIQAFDAIKGYVNSFRKSSRRNYYAIPLNLISRCICDDEEQNLSSDYDHTKFVQSLSWLSDYVLERVHLGFYCSDVYELKFNPHQKGLLRGSILKSMYDYAHRIYKSNGDNDYIVLRTNEIIANPLFDANSPEEVEFLIERCIECGFFSRDYMYVGVTINNNNYVQRKVAAHIDCGEDLLSLSLLCEMLKQFSPELEFEFLFNQTYTGYIENLDKQPSENEKQTLYSIISSVWEYAKSLMYMYTVDEINSRAKKLLSVLFSHKESSIPLLKLMEEMDINNDIDELKAFVLLLHKLNYLNKGNLGLDYVEVNIIDETPIGFKESDSLAKDYFDKIDKTKKEKAKSMVKILTEFSDSNACKEQIRRYSQSEYSLQESIINVL